VSLVHVGGLHLAEEEKRRRRAKGRSASGELDGHLLVPKATIFEEVVEDPGAREGTTEFEPVASEDPDVDWEGDVEWELEEEAWEHLLEDLFTHHQDEDDQDIFEEVRENLSWSEGEVIWEGMDFDQMFIDHGEYQAFELLSRKEKRAFLRERLRTQQASHAAEADESDLDIEMEPVKEPKEKAQKKAPRKDKGSGPLVSYETETEHMPEDLDLHISNDHGKGRRRRH
jgi:hypothetical protein